MANLARPEIEPRVAIAVHGRFHAFDLARGLAERGRLSQVATTYPALVARRFLASPIRLRTAPWLEAWRRLHGRVPLVPPSDPGVAKAFGRFAARTLPHDANVLVGWSGATLEAIAPAHARGMRVILERGSTHIRHQTRVLTDEYRRYGINLNPTPEEIIERELAEYEAADAIMTPSRFAAETFIAEGIGRNKLLINPFGVDAATYLSAPRPAAERPTILFVGRIGPRKGVATLLRAFAPLAKRARLMIVGPVEPGFESILKTAPLDGVVLPGPKPSATMAKIYADADIFCLPSIEEGLALVILQAMAAGLPVVTTEESGGLEAVRPNTDGLIVAAGDETALSAALARLVEDAALRRHMGEAARAHVTEEFVWQRYIDRALAAYRKVLGGSVPPEPGGG